MKLRTLKFHFPPNLVSSGGKSHSFEDCSSVLKETLLKDHAEDSMSYVLSFKASISTCAPSIPRIYPYLPPSKQTNVFALSHLSPVWLFVTLWTVARQAPLSMGFSRQEYWSGLPFPPPETKSRSCVSPLSWQSLPAMKVTLLWFLVRKLHWRRDKLPTPVLLGFAHGSDGKESSCNAVQSLIWEDPLKEGMAIHWSILFFN